MLPKGEWICGDEVESVMMPRGYRNYIRTQRASDGVSKSPAAFGPARLNSIRFGMRMSSILNSAVAEARVAWPASLKRKS